MAGKTAIVFSISEESSSGGSSCCWVERRTESYYLLGNELGEMAGPCTTAPAARNGSGFQFGMDHITIESSLPADEFCQVLASVIMENAAVMWVNGTKHERPTVEAVIAAYVPQ